MREEKGCLVLATAIIFPLPMHQFVSTRQRLA